MVIDPKRQALLSLLAKHDVTPSELARRAGVASGTLYSYLKGRTASLNGTTAVKLAAALDEPVGYITGDAAVVDADEPMPLRAISIVSEVSAGTWREEPDLPPDDRETIGIPSIPSIYRAVAFGVRVSGSSMDLVYPSGTILVCVPLFEFHREPRVGDRVIVRRERADLYETTVKELAAGAAGQVVLVPRSSRPEHQQPLPLDGDHQVILAVVIGSYREENSIS